MKQLMKALAIFLVCLCSRADGVSQIRAHECDAAMARFVEERLDVLSNWREFATFYRDYGRCDAPALSYGFTERIASLTMNSANLPDLQEEIRRNPTLKRVVLRHLRSESVSSDQAEKIEDATKSGCPRAARRLCKELLEAVNSGRK